MDLWVLTVVLAVLGTCSGGSQTCQPGTYMSGGQCPPCRLGYYQENANQPACDKCDAGLTTLTTGSTSKAACTVVCDAGNVSVVCDAGKEPAAGNRCAPCAQRFYKTGRNDQRCRACPPGRTTPATGSSDVTQCSVNRTLSSCPAGQEKITSSCSPCRVGYYKHSGSYSELCEKCPAPYVTSHTGATNIQHCNVSDCPAGTYRKSNNACHLCKRGFYQPYPWKSACKPCPAGTTLREGATSIWNCTGYSICTDNTACTGPTRCVPVSSTRYTCQCRHPYVGTGNDCRRLCRNYCNNGGTCRVVRNRELCYCPKDYYGYRCQIKYVEPRVSRRQWLRTVAKVVALVCGVAALLVIVYGVMVCGYLRRQAWLLEQQHGQREPYPVQQRSDSLSVVTYPPPQDLDSMNQYTAAVFWGDTDSVRDVSLFRRDEVQEAAVQFQR